MQKGERKADGLALSKLSFCSGDVALCLERILQILVSLVSAPLSVFSFFLSRPEGLLLLSGSALPGPAWWDPGEESAEGLPRLGWELRRIGEVAGD